MMSAPLIAATADPGTFNSDISFGKRSSTLEAASRHDEVVCGFKFFLELEHAERENQKPAVAAPDLARKVRRRSVIRPVYPPAFLYGSVWV
jgi:hypothetical protein